MCNEKYMQHFLLFQLFSMLSFITTLFNIFPTENNENLVLPVNNKITPIEIDTTIRNNKNSNSDSDSDSELITNENYDTFYCEEIDHNIPKFPMIRKSVSFNKLPKTNNIKTNFDNLNKYSNMRYCYKCNTDIYISFKPTYHAYDKMWCHKCWSQLDINNI